MSGRPEVAGHSQSARSARSALTARFGSFLSCLAVHKMHSQQSASAPEGGWLPGARPASAASRLFGQRPGAYPVGAGQGEPGRVAAERLQRLCSQRAGHRFRTKTRAARVGDEARGAYSRTQRQAQACVGYFFAVRKGSSPAKRCHGGARILPTHVREGCSAGRGSISWATNTHRSPKVRWLLSS